MKLIAHGAEAKLYRKNNVLIKNREPKRYRLKELDDSLRQFRTRREAKILEKINVPAPELIAVDDDDMVIEMSYIDGDKIVDILEDNLRLCKEIGKNIALMHNQGIIHEDLTTSNMIYKEKVYFIDFGLSYFSDKIEDMAVDLHLLRQALEAKHHTVWEEAFDIIITQYEKHADNAKAVLERLKRVEKRGRNKKKD